MSDITRDYSFGGWFTEFRIKHGFTLRAAAIKLKMDCGNLSKIELSRLPPPRTAKKIIKMCKALGFQEFEIEMLVSTAYSFHTGKLEESFNKGLK